MLQLKSRFLPSEGFLILQFPFASEMFSLYNVFIFVMAGIKKGNYEKRTGAWLWGEKVHCDYWRRRAWIWQRKRVFPWLELPHHQRRQRSSVRCSLVFAAWNRWVGNVVQYGRLQLTCSSKLEECSPQKMETTSIKQCVHWLKTWAASAHSGSTLPSFTVVFKPFCLQCCWHTCPSRTLSSCALPTSCQCILLTFFLLFILFQPMRVLKC